MTATALSQFDNKSEQQDNFFFVSTTVSCSRPQFLRVVFTDDHRVEIVHWQSVIFKFSLTLRNQEIGKGIMVGLCLFRSQSNYGRTE